MCPSTNTVWNLLLHIPTLCLQRLPRRCFPAHQIFWQTVQFGKIKRVKTILICELLFADDAALVSHTAQELQELLNRFSHACKEFGLMISIKKTKVMGQDVDNHPNVMIDGTPLDVMNTFTYLGATITSNLSLNEEITMKIDTASATIARLSK